MEIFSLIPPALRTYFIQLLYSAPSLLVCLVGIYLIMVRWKRHTRVSKLALAGLGLHVFYQMVNPVLSALYRKWLMSSYSGSTESERYMAQVIMFLVSLPHVLVYVLLLMAVLASRTEGKGSSEAAA